MHLEYVTAAANLRAEMYGIKQTTDRAAIAKMANNVIVPEFTPRSGVRIDVTDAEAQSRQHEGSLGNYRHYYSYYGNSQDLGRIHCKQNDWRQPSWAVLEKQTKLVMLLLLFNNSYSTIL